MTSFPYSVTVDEFMKPCAPKPPPLPTPFEMLTLPNTHIDPVEHFLAPEYQDDGVKEENMKRAEKAPYKPPTKKRSKHVEKASPLKKKSKKRRARTFHTICRKCNKDYYYTKVHLNEGRCGIDICHTCGMVRSLTPLQNLFF